MYLPSYLEIGILQKKYNEMTIPHEEEIATYYKLRQQLDKLGKEMHQFIVMPKYCVPFLQPGRMVKVGYLQKYQLEKNHIHLSKLSLT